MVFVKHSNEKLVFVICYLLFVLDDVVLTFI